MQRVITWQTSQYCMNTKFYEEISQPLKTKRVKAGNQWKITTLNEDQPPGL